MNHSFDNAGKNQAVQPQPMGLNRPRFSPLRMARSQSNPLPPNGHNNGNGNGNHSAFTFPSNANAEAAPVANAHIVENSDEFFDDPSVWDAIEQAEKQFESRKRGQLASVGNDGANDGTVVDGNVMGIRKMPMSNTMGSLAPGHHHYLSDIVETPAATSVTSSTGGIGSSGIIDNNNNDNRNSYHHDVNTRSEAPNNGGSCNDRNFVERQRRQNANIPTSENGQIVFDNLSDASGPEGHLSNSARSSAVTSAFNNRFTFMVNNRQNMTLRKAVYRETKFVNSNFPVINHDAAQAWIYPSSPSVREYQKSITKRALSYNTLVCLPTGLGKTLIAAVVMYNYYRWFPTGKVIFMAPTKPLVDQQMTACYNVMGIPEEDTVQLTGNVTRTKREQHWKTRRVFFATPQVVFNDLQTEICKPTDIVLLVFDEAHRAQNNYSYCTIMKNVVQVNDQFRVLALSASPGKNLDAVQRVIDHLQIAVLEIREEDDVDVKQYMITKNQSTQVVDLSKDIESLRDMLISFMKIPLDRLYKLKVLFTQNPLEVYRSRIEHARQAMRAGNLPHVNKQKVWVEIDLSLLLSLSHGMSLLLTNGPKAFLDFLEQCQAEVRDNRRLIGKKQFVSSNVFEVLLRKTRLMVHNKQTHPKIPILVEMVKRHLVQSQQEAGHTSRVIVFAQYRQTVEEIVEALSAHSPLVKAMQFVGQGKQRSGRGLTQKDQLAVIESFKKNEYNVLVSTSVGEEGLDIGEVDLVISYDVSVSPIRMIQRMGRTGRKREGNTVILLTRGIEDNIFKLSQANKEKVFQDIKNAISNGNDAGDEKGKRWGKKTLQLKFEDNNRMIPNDIRPRLRLSEMHIPKIRTQFNAISPSRKGKRKKGRQRQNQLITAPEQLYLKRSYGDINLDKPFLSDFFASISKSNDIVYRQSSFDAVYKIAHGTLNATYVNWMDSVEQCFFSDVIIKENMNTITLPAKEIDTSIQRLKQLRRTSGLNRTNSEAILKKKDDQVVEEDEHSNSSDLGDHNFEEADTLTMYQRDDNEPEGDDDVAKSPFDGYEVTDTYDEVYPQTGCEMADTMRNHAISSAQGVGKTHRLSSPENEETAVAVDDVEGRQHEEKQKDEHTLLYENILAVETSEMPAPLSPPEHNPLSLDVQEITTHDLGETALPNDVFYNDVSMQSNENIIVAKGLLNYHHEDSASTMDLVEYFPFGSKMLKRPRPLSERQQNILRVMESIPPAIESPNDHLHQSSQNSHDAELLNIEPPNDDSVHQSSLDIENSNIVHEHQKSQAHSSSASLSQYKQSPAVIDLDISTSHVTNIAGYPDKSPKKQVSSGPSNFQLPQVGVIDIDDLVPGLKNEMFRQGGVLNGGSPSVSSQSPVVKRRRLKKAKQQKKRQQQQQQQQQQQGRRNKEAKSKRKRDALGARRNLSTFADFLDHEAEEGSDEESGSDGYDDGGGRDRKRLAERLKSRNMHQEDNDDDDDDEYAEEENMYEMNSSFIDDGPASSSGGSARSESYVPVRHATNPVGMRAVYAQSMLSSPTVDTLRFRSPPKGRLAGKRRMRLDFDKYLTNNDTDIVSDGQSDESDLDRDDGYQFDDE